MSKLLRINHSLADETVKYIFDTQIYVIKTKKLHELVAKYDISVLPSHHTGPNT